MALNKKGFVGDIVTFVVILLVFAIVVFIVHRIYNDFNQSVQNDPNMAASVKTQSQELDDKVPITFDYAFAFLFIGSWLAGIILSAFTEAHPILIGLAWFITIIMLIGVMMMGNVYDSVATSSSISPLLSEYKFIPLVMDNIAVIGVLVAFSFLMALYVRVRNAY